MDNSVEKTVVTAYHDAKSIAVECEISLTNASDHRNAVEIELTNAKADEKVCAAAMAEAANKVDTFLNFIKLQGWKV